MIYSILISLISRFNYIKINRGIKQNCDKFLIFLQKIKDKKLLSDTNDIVILLYEKYDTL